jgi:aspartate carbamoyltransferase regulatory subunit
MTEMVEKTLVVSAIAEGTVIDHIKQGQALRIISMLKIQKNHQVTIGLNLISQTMQRKDLIKIENHFLSEKEAQEIALFAPDATINIICHYSVEKKIKAHLPQRAEGLLACPNPRCISRLYTSSFAVEEVRKEVYLHCKYCEKAFKREDLA